MTTVRFVTDSSLAHLARRLRFLGYDVTIVPGARLERLFEVARLEARTVLTMSGRRPPRHSGVKALTVPGADPAAATRVIVALCEPSSPPFSRCVACNELLEVRPAADAIGQAPERVLRDTVQLSHCPSCGRWYWEGSHVARVREWLARALDRAV